MSEKLTGRQYLAIDAMLAGEGHEDAAAAAGVTSRTLRRWRSSPVFRSELTTRATQDLDDTTRALTAAAGEAARVMRSVLNDEDAPPMVRLRAADLLLGHSSKLLELHSLLQRLDDLEARL